MLPDRERGGLDDKCFEQVGREVFADKDLSGGKDGSQRFNAFLFLLVAIELERVEVGP